MCVSIMVEGAFHIVLYKANDNVFLLTLHFMLKTLITMFIMKFLMGTIKLVHTI